MLPSQFLNVVLEEKPENDDESSDKEWDEYEHEAQENNNVLTDWELASKLPEALLSECTVEICRRPVEKKQAPKLRFEARVTPIYSGYGQKRPKVTTVLQDGTQIEEQVCVVQDILSEVEAVYSDDEGSTGGEEDGGSDTEVTSHRFGQAQPVAAAGLKPGGVVRPVPALVPATALLQRAVTGLKVGGPVVAGGAVGAVATPPLQTYQCDHCPNSYTNRGALWQHSVASHSLQKNCECGICGRKFYRNCSLALHLKSHAAEEEGLSKCPECGKEFTKPTTLEKHMRTAHFRLQQQSGATSSESASIFGAPLAVDPLAPKIISAQPQPTPILGAIPLDGGSNQSALPRPHRCVYCGKTYTQKSVLKKHLVIHTGERLTCALCGIDFTQKSSLLRHMKRMHSYEKDPATGKLQPIRIPQGISISMVE